MSPLQTLILARMRERGWTAKDVEAKGVKHATLHRYTNALVMRQPPRKAILQALADALELPLAKVERAAVESVGYEYTSRLVSVDPPGARSAEDITRQIVELIREHPGLSPVTKAHLAKQVEILALVPLDAPLTPHENQAITVEEADERDLTSLAKLSEVRDTLSKSPRPPRRPRR